MRKSKHRKTTTKAKRGKRAAPRKDNSAEKLTLLAQMVHALLQTLRQSQPIPTLPNENAFDEWIAAQRESAPPENGAQQPNG